MPLLDHFHPPLEPVHHWTGFHSKWTNTISDLLNEELLPKNYFAEPETRRSAPVEIDVATFERSSVTVSSGPDGPATATLPAKIWAPPEPEFTLPAAFPETFEIRVFGHLSNGLELVAAIELVSPSNKDESKERRAFAIKSASYLCQGISLIIVDIVTGRRHNLHNEVMQLLEAPRKYCLPKATTLYAVAYRPVRRDEKPEIDIWRAPLALAGKLLILPLSLRGDLAVPIDLDSTYLEACRLLRLP